MYSEAVINKQLTPSTLETASLDPAAHDDRVPSVLSARVRRPLKNNWIDSSAPSSYTSVAWNSINTVILTVIVCLCFARLKSIYISSIAESVLIGRSSGISSQRLYFGLYIFIFHNTFNSTAIQLVFRIISSTTEVFIAQRCDVCLFPVRGRTCFLLSAIVLHLFYTSRSSSYLWPPKFCFCPANLPRSGLITTDQAGHWTGQYSIMFY
jgi:hypothetical protein